MTGDTITIPRPEPGKMAVVVCAEDGAIAWVIGEHVTDPGIAAVLPRLLADAQDRLRAEYPKPEISR